MKRILAPTLGPTDWRRFLADPVKHWKQARSAYELAVAWEAAKSSPRGLPDDVAALLDTVPELSGGELLLGIPEHLVALPGGGHASQTDLWALLRTSVGLVSMAIEAKAGEDFDLPVGEWLRKGAKPGEEYPARSGKPVRLNAICEALGMRHEQALECRYQLMHRPVAAMLEAQRFGITNALFLVQSFDTARHGLEDYRCWAAHLGIVAEANQIHFVGERAGISLWIGWLSSEVASDRLVRRSLAPEAGADVHRTTNHRKDRP